MRFRKWKIQRLLPAGLTRDLLILSSWAYKNGSLPEFGGEHFCPSTCEFASWFMVCISKHRPVPFASDEMYTWKSLKLLRRGMRGEEPALMLRESYARQNPRSIHFWSIWKSLYFCHVESDNPRSSPSWPWFYNQPVAIVICSSFTFLSSNPGPEIIPVIEVGWKSFRRVSGFLMAPRRKQTCDQISIWFPCSFHVT